MSASQRPLRVLFIAHDSGLYGAQQCLLSLLLNLNRDIISPYVLCPYKGPFTEELEKRGIPVFVRSLHHWVASGERTKQSYWTRLTGVLQGLRGRVWGIAHLIERNSIDIVYTNTCTCIEGALAARIVARPHIWHLHEIIRGNRELKPILPQWIANQIISFLSARILVNSNFVAKAYRSRINTAKVFLVYNGIDLARFRQQRFHVGNVTEEFRIFPETKLVVIIGALHPRKGHLTFIDAASAVRSKIDHVLFLVVGDGSPDFVECLKSRVANKGLTSAFRFLGWRNDVEAILPNVDLLVVAAEQEPFGLTIVEAMASGTPVVATRSGGPEEIILDRKTGLLVPVAEPKELAAAIVDVLQDKILAKNLSMAGQAHVVKLFGVERYISNIQSNIIAAASVSTNRQSEEFRP